MLLGPLLSVCLLEVSVSGGTTVFELFSFTYSIFLLLSTSIAVFWFRVFHVEKTTEKLDEKDRKDEENMSKHTGTIREGIFWSLYVVLCRASKNSAGLVPVAKDNSIVDDDQPKRGNGG